MILSIPTVTVVAVGPTVSPRDRPSSLLNFVFSTRGKAEVVAQLMMDVDLNIELRMWEGIGVIAHIEILLT
jgi:hypothetical protein